MMTPIHMNRLEENIIFKSLVKSSCIVFLKKPAESEVDLNSEFTWILPTVVNTPACDLLVIRTVSVPKHDHVIKCTFLQTGNSSL
jgi:hypothetical protein